MGLTAIERWANGTRPASLFVSLPTPEAELAADCIEYVRDHAAWEHRAEYGCKCDTKIPCDLRALAERIKEMES